MNVPVCSVSAVRANVRPLVRFMLGLLTALLASRGCCDRSVQHDYTRVVFQNGFEAPDDRGVYLPGSRKKPPPSSVEESHLAQHPTRLILCRFSREFSFGSHTRSRMNQKSRRIERVQSRWQVHIPNNVRLLKVQQTLLRSFESNC